MSWMEAPWAGLMELAPRVDLWPILRSFGSWEAVRAATPEQWRAAGLGVAAVQRLMERRWEGEAFSPGMKDWIPRLEGLPRGPVSLLLEGERARLIQPAVAIIGSRECSGYGRIQARRLAEAVVAAGGVVVSGMAAGIDAEAHLAAEGRTIGVIGQGLASPMTAWQQRLRREMLRRGGLLVSEFPPGQSAGHWTFPVRNRVIAALARVVVVVEAGEQSGTRITVDHALRFGREVLAVPGPLDAPASVGCLRLIAEGATLVQGPQSVLEAAGLAGEGRDRYEARDDSSSPTS